MIASRPVGTFEAAVVSAASDPRLTDAARRVHAIVWAWLSPQHARRIDVSELAATLGLSLSSCYAALDQLVAAGYLVEGDRIRRERTFKRAA
jgi:DNA-binding MarR family transcriptional regulator